MTQPDAQEEPKALIRQGLAKSKYLWLIGIAIYAVFLYRVGWQNIQSSLDQLQYSYLVALVIAEAIALWIRIGKWHIALRPEPDITRLCFLSKAGGNLTPGRLGEFSPLLLKHFRSAKIGAWIFLDRLLEASSTLLLGLIGLIMVIGLVSGNIILYASVALLALIVAVSYVLMQERYILKLQALTQFVPLLDKPFALLLSVSSELQTLRPKIPSLFSLSLIATMVDIVVAYCICRSLGFHVAFQVLALTQVTHAVVSIIPFTPNATGVPYLAAATILYQFGGVSEDALLVIVIIRTLLANTTFWSLFILVMRPKKQT